MKVTKPTTHVVDIGPLDHAVRLPMRLRLKRGMTSRCVVCHKDITDDFFIAGFKTGERNMMMHETCAPADDPAIMTITQQEAE